MNPDQSSPGFQLGPIGQISVNARDLERAVRFYRDTLSLPLLYSAERMAFFDAHGIRLMVALPEREEFNHAGSIIYFSVPDIRKSYQQLVERGVHCPQPPHCVAKLASGELWMLFFHDTEGNLLALMSESQAPVGAGGPDDTL
ncbi:MAG TPA: VOC family protein [Terriglobales bacterium]|nr:VOC family protein [Terriglobales bacterium]